MRIRHYGFLANRYRKVRRETIRQLLGVTITQLPASNKEPDWLIQWLESIIGAKPETCPCCGDRLRLSELSNTLVSATSPGVKQKPIRGSPKRKLGQYFNALNAAALTVRVDGQGIASQS